MMLGHCASGTSPRPHAPSTWIDRVVVVGVTDATCILSGLPGALVPISKCHNQIESLGLCDPVQLSWIECGFSIHDCRLFSLGVSKSPRSTTGTRPAAGPDRR